MISIQAEDVVKHVLVLYGCRLCGASIFDAFPLYYYFENASEGQYSKISKEVTKQMKKINDCLSILIQFSYTGGCVIKVID